jgi:hypothetical protein
MVNTGVTRTGIIMLAVLLVMALIPAENMTAADDETSVVGEVYVSEPDAYTYGKSVVKSRSTLFAERALGEPDDESAYILFRGMVEIELEDSVAGADTVSIWAANGGFRDADVKVSVSSNGKKWTHAGTVTVNSDTVTRYDINGSFDNVKYIKVDKKGWIFSWLALDAVGVKGGDET